eukprot:7384045-Prymnesium_polylepis.1
MRCLQLSPHQRLGALPRDAHAKKDVVYLLVDRSHEWTVLSQSLPLLAKRFINESDIRDNGERCERVTVTGRFENMNQVDGTSGGWVKGRYRVSSLARARAHDAFESVRSDHRHAAIDGHKIRARDIAGGARGGGEVEAVQTHEQDGVPTP